MLEDQGSVGVANGEARGFSLDGRPIDVGLAPLALWFTAASQPRSVLPGVANVLERKAAVWRNRPSRHEPLSKRDDMKALRYDAGGLGVPANSVRQDSLVRFLPVIAASAYPFLLRAFHALVGPPAAAPSVARVAGAGAVLAALFCIPVLGIICAARPTQTVSARRLAYASVAAPTGYVFLGVLQAIVDEAVWSALWIGAAVIAEVGRSHVHNNTALTPAVGRWRVSHGISAAVVLIYVLFHISNDLFGPIDSNAHAAVMALGRRVYRAPAIEPLLVLLFQIGSSLYLARRWNAAAFGFHRLVQVASGF